VQKHPEKVAFYFNKEQWTFAKVWSKTVCVLQIPVQ
jgi:hypothetical protein